MDYRNFRLASYVYAYTLAKADLKQLQEGIDFLKRYVKLDKVS